MNIPLHRYALLACCLIALATSSARAEPAPVPPSSPAPLPPGTIADLEWFSTLGFPDVHGCPAVRVATGLWRQSSNQPPVNKIIRAFLLRHDDSTGRFSVLSTDLFTQDYETTKPGTPEHERVGYEEEPLATAADAVLAELARPLDKEDHLRRFRERLPERAEIFTWAWACWRNGLDDRAARFYAYAAAMTSRPGSGREKSPTPLTFREKLERDLGYAMIWRATIDFGDLRIARAHLLESFERVAHDYPRSEYAASTRQTADRLRAMIAEDAAHAIKPTASLDGLPPDDRVAELIYRLRDQNGQQTTQPGSCDIFADFSGMSAPGNRGIITPAHQLAVLGYAAVPRLIAALDDRTFSRSVGYGRNFYFSHHVLTVGDCAQQILEVIAARSFSGPELTSTYMSEDVQNAKVKEEVEAWWQQIQQRGEEGVLIDAVVKGDQNAVQQAGLLCKRYPDSALEPLIKGARNATDVLARTRLVNLAGAIAGEAPVPFLEEELQTGPMLSGRLAAARALWQHGRSGEAAAAMIQEWVNPRPPYRAGKQMVMGTVVTDTNMAAADAYNSSKTWEDWAHGELVGFLAGCGRVDAIGVLGRGLRQRPAGTRLDVVSAMALDQAYARILGSASGGMGGDPPERRLRQPDSDDETQVAAAIEALLASELDDDQQRFGLAGTRNGKHFSDPSIGDLAAEVLTERFKDKYIFDLGATSRIRARQRTVCLNVWRGRHGQELLPLPVERHVEPAPDGTILPLLWTLVASLPEEEHSAAVAAVTKLGPSALPALQTFKTGLAGDDPARERMENLERGLACTVVEAVLDNSPAPRVDERQRMAPERLDQLRGQPLTAKAFVELAIDAANKLSKPTDQFELRATRDEDLSGVRISLKFTAGEKGDAEKSTNSTNEHIGLGQESLYSSFGNRASDSLQQARYYKDFARAMERALEAAADQPFCMTVSERKN